MERKREDRTTSRSAYPESGSGARGKWIAPIVLLVLMVGTADLVSRSGQPFVVSFTDVALLVALAVVTGIYVILARADGRARFGLGQEPPAGEGVGRGDPTIVPKAKGIN